MMKKQISNNPIKIKRAEKSITRLEREGLIAKGVEIPKGILSADPDSQAHGGGYAAKFYYKDIHYTCAGCCKKRFGQRSNKSYFEIQKGNIYNEPKWCHE